MKVTKAGDVRPERKSNPRVAFFVCHRQANIATWFNNPVKMWVESGYFVDVITLKSKIHSELDFSEVNGQVFYMDGRETRIIPKLFSYVLESLRICNNRKYFCLVGFDPCGLITAGLVSWNLRVPFVYQSVEMTLMKEVQGIKEKIKKYIEPLAKVIK